MKTYFIGAFAALFCLGSATGATASQLPCDQKIYDKLYQTIIETTVKDVTVEEFEARNESIQTLRLLCQGQKSSYEKENPWDVIGVPF